MTSRRAYSAVVRLRLFQGEVEHRLAQVGPNFVIFRSLENVVRKGPAILEVRVDDHVSRTRVIIPKTLTLEDTRTDYHRVAFAVRIGQERIAVKRLPNGRLRLKEAAMARLSGVSNAEFVVREIRMKKLPSPTRARYKRWARTIQSKTKWVSLEPSPETPNEVRYTVVF